MTVQSGGDTLIVGTRRLLEEQGIALPTEAITALATLDGTGQTALLVARNGQVLGAIGARDRVRPEAAGVIAELRSLGIEPIVLLTGDRVGAAHAVAADIAFDAIHAELLPAQKAAFVTGLQNGADKRAVAMMGDGINDAPALAGADVGLAIGGTDIAAEAGDVVFMGEPLRDLPMLVRLARATVHVIRQNIFVFAFGVNGVGIVATAWLWPLLAPAGWWYEQAPVAAVIYHQLGSLAVLLNSMRLLWFERQSTVPALAGVKGWLRQTDVWMEKHLDADGFFHWLGHHRRGALGGAAACILGVYAVSGLTVVAPDELAVVRRFGNPVADVGPGWHWRWPWPIEATSRVSRRVRTVPIGFRDDPNPLDGARAFTWNSKHRENRIGAEVAHDHRRRQPRRYPGRHPLQGCRATALLVRRQRLRRAFTRHGRVCLARYGCR